MAKVITREWDHNGSFHLTIEESWPRTAATDKRVRRAARSADHMNLVKWTRINNVTMPIVGVLLYNITASRLDR